MGWGRGGGQDKATQGQYLLVEGDEYFAPDGVCACLCLSLSLFLSLYPVVLTWREAPLRRVEFYLPVAASSREKKKKKE